MKVIFLDIDGVLNNDKFLRRLRGQVAPLDDKVLYGSMMIDKNAIKRLHRIVLETDADIVISSSWREVFSLDEIQAMIDLKLDELGLEHSIQLISRTFIDNTTRKNQIVTWLNSMNDVEAFIILEDCEKMYELENKTIRTSWATGLTDFDVERAIMMLNEQL